MQNQGPPYQGPVSHGTFSDHTYNNQMTRHCAPNNYPQPYVNGPYPVGNPRGHHYGNHQMQQGPPPNHQHPPYRGSYAPPHPPQYANQDMYRNHHSAYVGGGNRNMHAKAVWNENSQNDMMPAYNHGSSRPQMINNSTPMNVSSMRSPPHLASVPSPGSQHYRQMQSPGHSPQTWPQVQAPSPGMHPVARTTPSPLQSHARSPGHNQPYSPSAAHMPPAVNIQPSHPVPSAVPENPQPAQMVNQGMNNVMSPAGPLHSLQKMVMLEPDATDSLQLPNESSCDQLPVCSANSVAVDEDMKDSSYATYYNLDENCLESKPQSTPTYSKPIEYNSDAAVGDLSCPAQDIGTQNQHNVPFPISNTEPVLESVKLNRNPELPNGPSASVDMYSVAEIQSPTVSETILQQEDSSSSRTSETLKSAVSNDAVQGSIDTSIPRAKNESLEVLSKKFQTDCNEQPSSVGKLESSENSNEEKSCKSEKDEALCSENKVQTNEDSRVSQPKIKIESNSTNNENIGESLLSENTAEQEVECDNDVTDSSGAKSKSDLMNERTLKNNTPDIGFISNSTVSLGNTKISTSEIARNPVKVVIHRIRTNDTNDTWHVPTPNGSSVITVQKTVSDVSKKANSVGRTINPKSGPQIIKLSPVMSKLKSPIGSDEENLIVSEFATSDNEDKGNPNHFHNNDDPSASSNDFHKSAKRKRPHKTRQSTNATKKKGRPPGSANKMKSSPLKKKKVKGKQKNAKKRPLEIEETQVTPKPKKAKPFNGPYLHVEGSKKNPMSITVVNVAIKEEEKGKILRTKINESTMVKRPRVGHTSTLSPHYDAFNKDRTWMCIFCHKGSHSIGLGDLYGPYYVKDSVLRCKSSDDHCGPTSRGVRSKRRKSDGSIVETMKSPTSQRKTPKQAAKFVEQTDTPVSVNSILQQTPPASEVSVKEVWIHEDCAIWCQSVSLLGSQILGLEEAIEESHDNMCSFCKLNGATLGCWCKGCSEQYHFSCAKEKGCKLDVENFSLFCPKHKDSRCKGQKKTAISATAANS